MTDRKVLPDPNDTPEDVATLYTWANLHGVKYRDFSASKAKEKSRQRVQEAFEAERRRIRGEAEAQQWSEADAAAEASIMAEARRNQEEAARELALRAEQAAQRAAETIRLASPDSIAANQQAPGGFSQAQLNGAPSQPAYSVPVVQPLYQAPANPAQYAPVPQPLALPAGEEPFPVSGEQLLQVHNPWAPVETTEAAAGPAWLSAAENAEVPEQTALPQVPEDTLQASRDRLTSRWFALNGLFNGGAAAAEAVPAPSTQPAPVLAVFSLAGGVGKTSLVATLGRALSACGERVLLVDTAVYGLLPFFFGARDQRPGVLRTFTAPTTSSDAPIQMITLDPEPLGPEPAPQETLTNDFLLHSRSVGRVIVDLATASSAATRRVLPLSPTVLVPVVPDVISVVSFSSIESFFQHHLSASGQPVRPYFVLNQFDQSLPLHLDIREVLREQIGDRLLPFVLRRSPAVSEALAEGMTVIDYAPDSNAAEDYANLAGWVKKLAAPATPGFRGVRWSER